MTAKLSSLQVEVSAERALLRQREKNTAAGLGVWSRRRTWSRTDTARWLSERSEPVLALLRRRPGQWPKHTKQIGYWLREQAPNIFDRAHLALAALANDEQREQACAADML